MLDVVCGQYGKPPSYYPNDWDDHENEWHYGGKGPQWPQCKSKLLDTSIKVVSLDCPPCPSYYPPTSTEGPTTTTSIKYNFIV